VIKFVFFEVDRKEKEGRGSNAGGVEEVVEDICYREVESAVLRCNNFLLSLTQR